MRLWGGIHPSLSGRVRILKALVVSRALYLMMVNGIPKKFADEMERNIRSFLWNGRKGAISWERAIQSKKEGGLSAPSIHVLYETTKIMWIKQWLTPEPHRPKWAHIANSIVKDTIKNPKVLPKEASTEWIEQTHLNSPRKQYPQKEHAGLPTPWPKETQASIVDDLMRAAQDEDDPQLEELCDNPGTPSLYHTERRKEAQKKIDIRDEAMTINPDPRSGDSTQNNCHTTRHQQYEPIRIISDSLTNLTTVGHKLMELEDKGWYTCNHADILKEILARLRIRPTTCELRWTRGHDGNIGNEKADRS